MPTGRTARSASRCGFAGRPAAARRTRFAIRRASGCSKPRSCAGRVSSNAGRPCLRACPSATTSCSVSDGRGHLGHAPDRGPGPRLSAAGPRRGRARRGRGGQPVRAPFEPELGLRRSHRPGALRGLGGRKISAAPSSRSIRCMRFTTGSPSTPARICRTPSSTAIPSTWTSSGWRISASLAARRLFLRRPGRNRKSPPCAPPSSWSTSGVYALKLRFLRLCFETFLQRCRRGAGGLRGILPREGELLDRYATYCALDEWIHRRIPTSGSGRTGRRSTATPNRKPRAVSPEAHREEILFHKYVQWQLDRQLGGVQQYALEKGLSIGLYHDLALATDRCGSDLWAYPALLRGRLPRGLAARRVLPQRTGLGLPASQHRASPRGRLPPVRRNRPAQLPSRRRSAHRSRHALLPALLDPRRDGGGGRHLRPRLPRGPAAHPGVGERAESGS